MAKRTKKDSGEERVRAKSKPMMNSVSRCHALDSNVVASTAGNFTEIEAFFSDVLVAL